MFVYQWYVVCVAKKSLGVYFVVVVLRLFWKAHGNHVNVRFILSRREGPGDGDAGFKL